MTKQPIYNYTNTLREHRKKHHLLQSQVARLLGFQGEDRISHWEKGRGIPSLTNLIKLCILFRVNVFDLYPLLTELVEDEVEGRKLEVLVK